MKSGRRSLGDWWLGFWLLIACGRMELITGRLIAGGRMELITGRLISRRMELISRRFMAGSLITGKLRTFKNNYSVLVKGYDADREIIF